MVDAASEVLDRVDIGTAGVACGGEHKGVCAAAAVQYVLAGATDQSVIPRPAGKDVVAALAIKPVVTCPTLDRISPAVAKQSIGKGAANEALNARVAVAGRVALVQGGRSQAGQHTCCGIGIARVI